MNHKSAKSCKEIPDAIEMDMRECCKQMLASTSCFFFFVFIMAGITAERLGHDHEVVSTTHEHEGREQRR